MIIGMDAIQPDVLKENTFNDRPEQKHFVFHKQVETIRSKNSRKTVPASHQELQGTIISIKIRRAQSHQWSLGRTLIANHTIKNFLVYFFKRTLG